MCASVSESANARYPELNATAVKLLLNGLEETVMIYQGWAPASLSLHE